MPYCVKCGSKVNEEDQYCSSCGALQPIETDKGSKELMAPPDRLLCDPESINQNAKASSGKSNGNDSRITKGVIITMIVAFLVLSSPWYFPYIYQNFIVHPSSINESPKSVVESYLKAISGKDNELFYKCVEGRGEGSLKQQMLNDDGKHTFLGGNSYKDDFDKQMDEASSRFSKQFGINWVTTVQIKQPNTIKGDECIVTISIGNSVATLTTTKNGRKGWFLLSGTYDVLFPELEKLLTTPPSSTVQSNNSNPTSSNSQPSSNSSVVQSTGKVDFRLLLQMGIVPGLDFSIGDDIKTIMSKLGQPDEKGSFHASNYIKYLKYRVRFFYGENSNNKVSSIEFTQGFSLYDVVIGGQLFQMQKALGKPDSTAPASTHDELAFATDTYCYEYTTGNYRILFYRDDNQFTHAYLLRN